ncbi:MAG: tRNA (adenosine(37)-N6)-threonylcarbamoyltransferase complex dimerization subunit type 1 TsaB, partial [Bacteroidales bacterium]
MGLILNIETATNVCSVALADNGLLVSYKESLTDKSHSSLLSVFIEEILNENKLSVKKLDAVAVSKGPGSYTGLRIGVSTAKGLCYGANIPLISLNTLKVMSSGIINNQILSRLNLKTSNNILLCPMIDARRLEVFTAIFNQLNQTIEETQAKIINRSSYDKYLVKNKLIFFGTGAYKCTAIINSRNALFIENFNTSARYMTGLSEENYRNRKFENVAYFEPYYLKDFIATVPK